MMAKKKAPQVSAKPPDKVPTDPQRLMVRLLVSIEQRLVNIEKAIHETNAGSPSRHGGG